LDRILLIVWLLSEVVIAGFVVLNFWRRRKKEPHDKGVRNGGDASDRILASA
jgi:hypothetical protein